MLRAHSVRRKDLVEEESGERVCRVLGFGVYDEFPDELRYDASVI